MTFYKGHKRINGAFGERKFLLEINRADKDWPERKGEKNGNRKLSDHHVKLIRSYPVMPQATAKKIAGMLGICHSYVYHLRNKNLNKWAHLK